MDRNIPVMIKTSWNGIKRIKIDNNKSIFYSVAEYYRSNNPSLEDMDKYDITIQDGVQIYYTVIIINTSPNDDQLDFESNYKSISVEV